MLRIRSEAYHLSKFQNEKRFKNLCFKSFSTFLGRLKQLKNLAIKYLNNQKNNQLMGVIGQPEFERCIEDMEVGESGYAFPWALNYDEDNVPYLDITHPIFENRKKKSLEDLGERIFVKKIGPGKEDYDVTITNTNYRWTQEQDIEQQIIQGNQWIVCLDPVKAKRLEKDRLEFLAGDNEEMEYAGGVVEGSDWKDYTKSSDISDTLSFVDDDPEKFPETYDMRKDLNALIQQEMYEDAAEMRDMINNSSEPLGNYDPLLEHYEDSYPTIEELANDVAKKIVARKRPCSEDPFRYPATHQYRRNLNQLKAEGHYDLALEVAVLINSTQEPLEL